MGELFATFGIDWRLLTIQAVNFGIALVVLWWFLYRPIFKIIEKRKEVVAQGVADASEAARAKETIEGERAGIVAGAQKDAEAVMVRAAEEGKREREAIVKAANERAEAALRDATLQAEEAKRRALQESEKEIARTAVLAAEKILQKS